MEHANPKSTASHYFQTDSASIFDEISKNQNEKLVSEAASFVKEGYEESAKEPVEKKLEMYFPGPSSFSFISGSTTDETLIKNISLTDMLLPGGPQTLSSISSELDGIYDAWIPSTSTQETLTAMALSPGTFKVDKTLLVTPGIVIKEEFGDPIRNLVQTYFGEDAASQRRTLTAASVTQDDRGLRQLIANGCYHAAVNLTTQLLTVYGQGERKAGQISKHTAHSIQLWFTRIALLLKLRRFSLAEVECEAWGDLNSPDLYFEFYPELYGGRTGSMVPFSFRILVAELPQYLGRHTQSLDRLGQLLTTCNKILENLSNGPTEAGLQLLHKVPKDEALKVWRARRLRLIYSLVRCAVGLKDFRLASTLLQRLLREEEDASGLFSSLGRLCLHLGDIHSAQEAFKRHLEHSPVGGNYDPVQGLLHSAFIACAKNDFGNATQILQQAHEISSENPLVINNLGVCLMFIGRIREAIRMVEAAVVAHPEKLLHEALVLNLSTMYELESSNAHKKKLNLLSLVAAHKGDGFNIAALKLQV